VTVTDEPALRGGIEPLLAPGSVAVVGASPRHPRLIANLLGSEVPVWGVHPTRAEACGITCFPSVAELPDRPELTVRLVGAGQVEDAFAEAVAAGARAVVLPGLGNEAGPEAGPVMARIAAAAAEHDVAVLGPNCMGAVVPGRPSAWLAEIPREVRAGHVAAVVQSGSVGEALMSMGARVGLRCVISAGAEALRDAADYVAFLAGDEATRVVALFLETVRRPAAFARALELCAERGKPVVCLRVGRSEGAARIAVAHTGAVVGSDVALAGVLRRFGAIDVEDYHDFVETLEVLGRERRPRGARIGAISESGGFAALLADHAERAGVPLPELGDELAAALRAAFPNFLSPQNPLDAWAIDEPGRVYPGALELLAASGRFDVLLAQIELSQFRGSDEEAWCGMIMRALARIAADHGLFGAVSSVGSSDPPPSLAAAAGELDLALLRGADHAVRTLAAVAGWAPAPPRRAPDGPAVDLGDLLAVPGPLPEHESSLVLERYGIAVAPRRRAASPEAAADAGRELGFPVVVKVDGPAHKSAAGGVVLGLETPDAVADAARRLGGRVLVARQVPAGAECLCGMVRDPGFGPVLAVGRGGTDVEARRPRAVLAPVEHDLAGRVVAEAGLGGEAAPLAGTLVALGRLALEHPRVAEVDINPLVLTAAGPVAVDALVVVEGDPP
jgi:acetyltransferase